MVVIGYQDVCPLAGPNTGGLSREREDNIWMVSSGILVLSMNAAFGLLEAGSVRNRNVLNIMMKNLSDLTLGGVMWWIIGYYIAFEIGTDSKWPHSVHDETNWFFQWTFVSTAATIDSGAIAERVNFLSYVGLSLVTSGFIYPFVVNWAWVCKEGTFCLIKDQGVDVPGFSDFAGGAVVHMLGGVSALVCCLVVGPRIGRFQNYQPKYHWWITNICKRSCTADYYIMPAGYPQIIAVTDPVSLIWGVFFLWIGWYGFNPGAVPHIEYGGTYVIGRVVVNTTLGALGGGFMNFILMMILNRGKAYAEGFALGVLSGLVSITAGCLWFGNGDCFLIGMMGAVIAEITRRVLVWAWIDDVVSAIPVHCFPGFFGTICIAFFAQDWSCNGDSNIGNGIFYAKNDKERAYAWKMLEVQLKGCLQIAAWSASTTFVALCAINQIPGMQMRIGKEVELKGLDEAEHDMTHDAEDFQEIMKRFLEILTKQTGDNFESRVKNASTEALKCLTFGHHMEAFASSRNKKHRLALVIKDIMFTGLTGVTSGGGCFGNGGATRVMIEIVSAVKLDDYWQHDFNYKAPRFAAIQEVNEDKKETLFAGNHIFSEFYMPPGSEEAAFACITLFRPEVSHIGPLGQVHIPLASPGWVAVPKDEALPGYENAVEAMLTQNLVFAKESLESSHPNGVQVDVHVIFMLESEGVDRTTRNSTLTRMNRMSTRVKGSQHHSGKLGADGIAKRLSVSQTNTSSVGSQYAGATSTANGIDCALMQTLSLAHAGTMQSVGEEEEDEPKGDVQTELSELREAVKLLRDEVDDLKTAASADAPSGQAVGTKVRDHVQAVPAQISPRLHPGWT